MRALKTIVFVALVSLTGLTIASAQATRWRIMTGPGAGVTLNGSGTFITDLFAEGSIAFGHFPDCECTGFDGHYHGTLFGKPDPAPGNCGWGCVLEIAATRSEAATNLHNAIDFIGTFINPDLADKLDDIFHDMENAASVGCYSVVDALADAFSEELEAYFDDFGYPLSDPAVSSLVEYVNANLDSATLPYDKIPPIPTGTAKLLRRIGTGEFSRLLDAGPRMTLHVGEMISLEGLGSGTGVSRWDVRWKGMPVGEHPTFAAAAFRNNLISAISEKPTSLRLTYSLIYPNNKVGKDTFMVNWIP